MLNGSISKWVERVTKSARPTKGDMMLVGNYFKAQSLDRTSRGIDADGKPFSPYSEKRPYYWNPYSGDKKQGGTWTKQNQSMNRMIKKLGGGNLETGEAFAFSVRAGKLVLVPEVVCSSAGRKARKVNTGEQNV